MAGGRSRKYIREVRVPLLSGDEMVRLRAIALPRERETVLRFLRDSNPEDYLLSYVPTWNEGEGHLLLEDLGEWVGLATLEDLGEGEAWIGGLRIARPLRGRGFGGHLLEGVISWGSGRGLRVFRALVERENVASHALFRRHGFLSVADLTLQSGPALRSPSLPPIHRVGREGPPLDLRPGWTAQRYGRVDRVGPHHVGRFVGWREGLLDRWAEEGSLYLSGDNAWLARAQGEAGTGSLWVSPLRGELQQWTRCASHQARTLGLPSWEAFLPETRADLEAYRGAGLGWAGTWGESVTLYERGVDRPGPGPTPSLP